MKCRNNYTKENYCKSSCYPSYRYCLKSAIGPGLRGPTGPQGPIGPTGPQGVTGPLIVPVPEADQSCMFLKSNSAGGYDLSQIAEINNGNQPMLDGYITWSDNPYSPMMGIATVGGVMDITRLSLQCENLISQITFDQLNTMSASDFLAGQCAIGLYDQNGTLVSQVSNPIQYWDGMGGIIHVPLDTPVLVGAENQITILFVGVLTNYSSSATDTLSLNGPLGISHLIKNPSYAGPSKYGIYGTNLTSLPATIQIANILSRPGGAWYALS